MIDELMTISTLVGYINNKIYNDSYLRNVKVTGELGNFSNYKGSGHWYFTLKDEKAQIKCAMFKGYNNNVQFIPKDGDSVVVVGSVNIYENRGELQIVVTDMQLSGQGNFYIQFEKTKAKLEPLGYFDENNKKAIKIFPNQITVVTGANTAALQDIRITIAKRWPAVVVKEVYAIVQGKEAIESIVKALKEADSQGSDTIILARGGGSVDDLWCFNDETIAKTIFELKTPIITGIGHEIDFTIADLVADYRAATPTAAAQKAVPDQYEVKTTINNYIELIDTVIVRKLQKEMQTLDIYQNKLQNYAIQTESIVNKLTNIKNIIYLSLSKNIDNQLERKQYNVELLNNSARVLLNNAFKQKERVFDRFKNSFDVYLNILENNFSKLVITLDNISPLKMLARGYIISSQNGKVIKSVKQIKEDQEIDLKYSDGEIKTMIVRNK